MNLEQNKIKNIVRENYNREVDMLNSEQQKIKKERQNTYALELNNQISNKVVET